MKTTTASVLSSIHVGGLYFGTRKVISCRKWVLYYKVRKYVFIRNQPGSIASQWTNHRSSKRCNVRPQQLSHYIGRTLVLNKTLCGGVYNCLWPSYPETLTLSRVGPGQCLDERPSGITTCCKQAHCLQWPTVWDNLKVSWHATRYGVISRYKPFWKSAPYDITGGRVHLDVWRIDEQRLLQSTG